MRRGSLLSQSLRKEQPNKTVEGLDQEVHHSVQDFISSDEVFEDTIQFKEEHEQRAEVTQEEERSALPNTEQRERIKWPASTSKAE